MALFKSIKSFWQAFKFKCLVLLLSVFVHSAFSQQSAHFILGENQFRGVQVYDVIQDKALNYWFATNEGLFVFDHYSYQKIDCKDAKSNSVFDFVINSKGTIYCHNLNNQVFQIKNGSYSLFYELKSDEVHPDLSLIVTDQDHLLIGSKKIIEISEDGKVLDRTYMIRRYLGPPFISGNNTIYYYLGGSDSILIIDHRERSIKKINCAPGLIAPNSVLKFFSHHSLSYAINLKTKELFSFNTTTFELKSLGINPVFSSMQHIRLYTTDDNLWIAGTLPGVILLEDTITSLKTKPLYENYFISDVYRDQEGNILLSTFDKGILVIPDLKTPDVINSFREDPVTSLFSDPKMGLLLGSSKGLLWSYDDQTFNLLNNNGKRPIEHLHSKTGFPFILFDDGYIRLFNKQSKRVTDLYEASLKDAVICSNELFYLGTNRGIIKCEKDGTGFKCTLLKNFAFRVYCMALDTLKNLLYASTSNGLFCINADGEGISVTHKNEALFPNTLYFNNGKMYAATKNGEVPVIENEHVIRVIQPLINGLPEPLSKFIIYKNTFIAKSGKGLFQFDLNGKLLNALNSSQGFSTNRIIDFTIRNDQLWVSHTNGVQQINLNGLQQRLTKPLITLSEVNVNDSAINPLTLVNFSHNERKIEFTLSSPTLRNRENMRYHYKLEGNDEHWNVNHYISNKILYNALAPGSYTFYAKSEKQGVFSDTISYSFNIASPVYTRWWFLALMVLIFLVSVYLLYQWQLNIQRKKSQRINELNASKLTAIQSQMNPHFIFNSLNSIQDLILKGDVEHSYSYIITFSNLVRRTLSYSDKDLIDFEQEIKLIELYLSLEKLRFKKDFSYTVNTNGIMDIQIPPMLIQPFIENALVHGLLHKEDEKKLSIHFELKENLICTIEDNGVGREKAKAIKQRQRSEHESFSGKAIHKRFEILSSVFEGQFGYTYEDLKEDNIVRGTRVTLVIPIKHKF